MVTADSLLPTHIEDPGPDIGFAEAEASALYGRDYRKVLASDDGFQRLDAVERLTGARAALSAGGFNRDRAASTCPLRTASRSSSP